MLDYPISVPRDTLYARLGITPEATPAEIDEAKTARTQEIAADERRVAKRLDEIDARVEGLAQTRQEYERAKAEKAPEETRNSIRARLDELERVALGIDPEYHTLRREKDELNKRLTDLNRMEILDPQARADYDRAHPPLNVLRLAACGPDLLGEDPEALSLLRAELSRFLEDRGEDVFHPTDVTRRDFSGDFTHTPLLDGEE